MNRPPNPHKYEAGIIASAAGIASGHGEYELANQLWRFEKELHDEGVEIVEQELARRKEER